MMAETATVEFLRTICFVLKFVAIAKKTLICTVYTNTFGRGGARLAQATLKLM